MLWGTATLIQVGLQLAGLAGRGGSAPEALALPWKHCLIPSKPLPHLGPQFPPFVKLGKGTELQALLGVAAFISFNKI